MLFPNAGHPDNVCQPERLALNTQSKREGKSDIDRKDMRHLTQNDATLERQTKPFEYLEELKYFPIANKVLLQQERVLQRDVRRFM